MTIWTRKISGHSYQMPKISGQSVIWGQFQDSFEISGTSGRLWPLVVVVCCSGQLPFVSYVMSVVMLIFCENYTLFSEREFKFTFAICHRRSVCLSVCLSSVCNVGAPYSGDWNFRGCFYAHLVPWPSVDIQVKFYEDRPRGTPPTGELQKRGGRI